MMSIYQPSGHDPKTAIYALKLLSANFPKTNPIVLERISKTWVDEQWSDKRINDAVDHLCKTYSYPSITTANVLGFDRKVKLYTYSQVIDHINKYGGTTADFGKVRVDNKLYWTR